MRIRWNILHLVICTTFVVLFSCSENHHPEAETISTESSIMEMSAVEVNLPKTGAYELFERNCLACHSLRYIEMQPHFPPKTWENIVHKMIKNYGAPIPDTAAAQIIEYLVEIKGKK